MTDVGNEVKSFVNYQVPVHLWSFRNNINGYVDLEGNRVSGRSDTIELCTKCSNTVHSAAISALLEIQKTLTLLK